MPSCLMEMYRMHEHAGLPLIGRWASRSRAARSAARALIAVLGLGILGAGCGSSESSGPRDRAELTPTVEAVQARYGSLPLTERLSGKVRARNQIEVYPQISGVISQVKVENGGAVREGQTLVTLRDAELRQQLKQVEASRQIALAQLQRAESAHLESSRALERMKSLIAQELASQADLEDAQTRADATAADVALARARVEQAEASVEEERENLSYAAVKAPVEGTVGNRNAEVGMLVNPNTRLFTLGQLDSVQVEVILTDRMLVYLKEGQRTTVTAAGEVRTAQLSRISPFLHPVAHSTTAEIDLDNAGHFLRSGMFVTVDIFYGESEDATLVPLSALYENPATGTLGVYVTRDTIEETVREVPDGAPQEDPVAFEFITTEVIAEGRMEAAVRGVDEGMWVISMGQHLLGGKPGEARVRPVTWDHVERLQRLQRDDLLDDLMGSGGTKKPL